MARDLDYLHDVGTNSWERSACLTQQWTVRDVEPDVFLCQDVLWSVDLFVRLLISAPSLGVYYCQQLTLSVCQQNFKLLLFCFLMESSHFWPSVLHDPLYKTLFFNFWLRPPNDSMEPCKIFWGRPTTKFGLGTEMHSPTGLLVS